MIPKLRDRVALPVELYTLSFVENLNLRIELKHLEEETVSPAFPLPNLSFLV